ncbi:MAG: hypothetical protein JNK11_17830 [Alphaproteobacteria bacterium]|nr:hypothetical protein [Alphaproteobacteria bacterium]
MVAALLLALVLLPGPAAGQATQQRDDRTRAAAAPAQQQSRGGVTRDVTVQDEATGKAGSPPPAVAPPPPRMRMLKSPESMRQSSPKTMPEMPKMPPSPGRMASPTAGGGEPPRPADPLRELVLKAIGSGKASPGSARNAALARNRASASDGHDDDSEHLGTLTGSLGAMLLGALPGVRASDSDKDTGAPAKKRATAARVDKPRVARPQISKPGIKAPTKPGITKEPFRPMTPAEVDARRKAQEKREAARESSSGVKR